MLRMIIPVSLVVSCLTLHAEGETSVRTTTLVFEIPADDGKPTPLSEKDKARIEARLKNVLKEMTVTATSITWTPKHDMVVVLPAMGELVRQTVVKNLSREAFLEKGQLRLHRLHPESDEIIARLRANDHAGARIPGYAVKTLLSTDPHDKAVPEKLLVCSKPILDSSFIKHAQELYGPHEGKISVELNQEGAKIMFTETGQMQHGIERIAIILDGKVLSAPVVQDTLGARFEISGMNNAAEARKIAAALLSPVSKPLSVKSINPPLAK